MQWLIDLVIEAIGIQPTYIHRGEPLGHDFELGDLTVDDTPYDLDLSAIVPAGATAVALSVTVLSLTMNEQILFYKKGDNGVINISRVVSQVAVGVMPADIIVALDSNRFITYEADGANFIVININVKGWWL